MSIWVPWAMPTWKSFKKSSLQANCAENIVGSKDAKNSWRVQLFCSKIPRLLGLMSLFLQSATALSTGSSRAGTRRGQARSLCWSCCASSSARPAASGFSAATSLSVVEGAATPCRTRPAAPAAAPAAERQERLTTGTTGPAFKT